MEYKNVSIKMNNNTLDMSSVVNIIEGRDDHLSDNEKQRYPIKASNNNNPTFKLVKGTEYFVTLVIRQKNDEKYKITVSGAESSNHPTSEQTLDGNIDVWPFNLIA